jgi:hypothetical protein
MLHISRGTDIRSELRRNAVNVSVLHRETSSIAHPFVKQSPVLSEFAFGVTAASS